MYGPGFEALPGTVRISLANKNKEDYIELARSFMNFLMNITRNILLPDN